MSISYSDSIIARRRAFSEKELTQSEEKKPVQGKNMRTITFPNHTLRLEIILLA